MSAQTDAIEFVHQFLVSNGHTKAAKALLEESKAKVSGSGADLVEAYTEFLNKKRPAAGKAPAAKKAKPADSDDDSSDSDSDSDSSSSDDEAPAPAPAKKAAAAPAPAAVKAAAAKAVAAESSDSDSSESSDSDSSDDEEPKKKPAAKAAAPAPAAAAAATPKPAAVAKKEEETEGSEGQVFKAFVKGLPWKATEKELADFFKACGKVLSVELPVGEDGRSTGNGYVKFSQRSELDAALALDGQYWPGTERWLKILEGTDRPERKSFSGVPGVRPEGCDTVFVGNLSWDVTEEQIRELFGSVGEVSRVRFATAEDGSFKGFGHVQFADGDSTEEAVKLAGSDLCGRPIRVDYAPPRNRESFGEAGGRGGGRGGAGGRGGRGDGGGRGGAGRGRGGGRTPTINKAKGTIAASSGKKISFGEDEE